MVSATEYKWIGIIGLVLISLGMLVKHRTMRDLVSILGGLCLLLYSMYLRDAIFIVLQVIFVAVSGVDFVDKRFMHKKNADIC